MQTGQTKYGTGMTVSACAWLGLFPLLQCGTYHTITRDKWIIMFLLAGITLACFVTDLFFRRVSRPRIAVLLAGGGLLLWLLLSCLFSPYPVSVWWVGAGRLEGLASQLCYLGLFFLFSFSRVRRTSVLISTGCGLFIFFVVVMMQRAGQNPLGLYPEGYSYRNARYFLGTIGNTDMCAGYLLVLAGLFLPVYLRRLRRVFRSSGNEDSKAARSGPAFLHAASVFFLHIASGLCLFLLVTVGVRFGLLVLVLLLILVLVRFLPKKLRIPVLLLFCVLVLAVAWFFPGGQSGMLHEMHEILHGRILPSFGNNRLGVWSWTVAMLREEGRLLLGTGADTYAARFSSFLEQYAEEHPEAELPKRYFDNPHCEVLALLSNSGIPALLLFAVLVFLGCSGASAWRDSVFCFAIQLLFSFSVCIVSPMFWAVLGLSCSMPPPKKPKPELQKA